MALPAEEELIPIKDLADRLKITETYLLAKLRRRQFPRVIIEKKTSSGGRWMAHYYFDKAFWPFTDKKEKAFTDRKGQTHCFDVVTDESEKEYRLHSDLADEKTVSDWPQKDWHYLVLNDDNDTWLEDAQTIYIPAAVEAFRATHGLHPQGVEKSKKQSSGRGPGRPAGIIYEDRQIFLEDFDRAVRAIHSRNRYVIVTKEKVAEEMGISEDTLDRTIRHHNLPTFSKLKARSTSRLPPL